MKKFPGRIRKAIYLGFALFLLFSIPLGAIELIATYEPVLKPITEAKTKYPNLNLKGGAHEVVIKVGTLTISSVNTVPTGWNWNEKDKLILQTSGYDSDSDRNFILLDTNNKTYDSELGYYIHGANSYNNSIAKTLKDLDVEKTIATGKDLNKFTPKLPIVIDFFLVVKIKVSELGELGFQFQSLQQQPLGIFSLELNSNNNANTMPSYTTSFGANYYQGSSNYVNADTFNQQVYVNFTIEQESFEKTIDLADAVGSNKKKIGAVRIELTGFNRVSTEGVRITFTDGNSSPTSEFRLKHHDVSSYIPFSLKLNDQPIYNGGTGVVWGNLSYGNANVKDLYVTGIDNATALGALSGPYSDTIIVNITPIDSHMEKL